MKHTQTSIPRLIPSCAIAALAILCFAVPAQADIIAYFPLENNSPSSVVTLPGVDVSDFTIGAGLDGGAGIGGVYKSLWARSSKIPATEATALSSDSYFSFTVNVDNGYTMDLSALSFGTIFNGTDGIAAMTGHFFVRSSLDGFSTNIGSTFTESYTLSDVFTPRTIDLSGAAFQVITESVEFRFYIYDNSGADGRYLRIDEIVLQGDVNAIPEPSTTMAVFAAAAIIGVIASRRLRGGNTVCR